MKIEIDVKRISDNPPTYQGTITAGDIKEVATWAAGPDVVRGVVEKGMNIDYLAYYNIGKQLLTDAFRARFYPAGDPLKSPRDRVNDTKKIVTDHGEQAPQRV